MYDKIHYNTKFFFKKKKKLKKKKKHDDRNSMQAKYTIFLKRTVVAVGRITKAVVGQG